MLDGMVLFEWVVLVVVVWWYWWKCSCGSCGLMVVVTALIRVAFLFYVGSLYSIVFMVGLVVVIIVMVGLVVVGVTNYWCWLWQSGGCGKGCNCSGFRRGLGV